jgi:hypothetical protein
VPERLQPELHALEALDDDALRSELDAELAPAAVARYDALLEASAASTLDDAARRELTELRDEADRLMFRRAYAALLLKWRGHPLAVPSASQPG